MLPSALIFYLLAINLIAAYLFWLDWRFSHANIGIATPEYAFLVIGILGGAFGIVLVQGLTKHRLYRQRTTIKYRVAFLIQFSIFLSTPDVVFSLRQLIG